jgi:hypothetical protein
MPAWPKAFDAPLAAYTRTFTFRFVENQQIFSAKYFRFFLPTFLRPGPKNCIEEEEHKGAT